MATLVADLWEGYAGLTAPQKHVVFQMFWHGYTADEMAETMGVSQQAVHATLARAEKKLREKLQGGLYSGTRQPFKQVKEEKQGTTRGNGQRPDQSKAPASSGPPCSASPQPDVYLGTPQRNAFVKELSWCAASPFLQLQNRGGYNERARRNRERIALG